MSDTWLTYAEAAERLGVTVEAARQRAIRGRWQRMQGNDGRARVRLPDGERTPSERTSRSPVQTPPSDRTVAERLTGALEAHIDTLKGELAAERGRTVDALAQLAAEKLRADQAVADYVRLAAEYRSRVDELIEAHARPWWRKIVGS